MPEKRSPPRSANRTTGNGQFNHPDANGSLPRRQDEPRAQSPVSRLPSPAAGAGRTLMQVFESEVLPRLTVEQVFTAPEHNWKERGPRKLKGGCPWHDSKSGTAFVVNATSLQWWCPGCGIGGGPIQYVHRLSGGIGTSPRGEDFIRILRELFSLAGVSIPERDIQPADLERERRVEARRAVLGSVIAGCQEMLESAAGKKARTYLKRRGFEAEHIQSLGFGLYADSEEMARRLRDQGHDEEAIHDACAVWRKLEGYVTVPWYDEYGRPLTIYGVWPKKTKTPPGGRPHKLALPNPKDAEDQDLEHTKRSPYCFDRARTAQHKAIVLVEGVLDAALLQARGDTRVVACVGAQLSEAQTATLARHSIEKVIICLDPDSAGDRGIESCLRSLRKAKIDAYVAPKLPDGMDPDEFVIARGMDAWREHIARADTGATHEVRKLLGGVTPESPEQARRDKTKAVLNHLASLDPKRDAIDIKQALDLISEATGFRTSDLKSELVAARKDSPQRSARARATLRQAQEEYAETESGIVWHRESDEGTAEVALTNFHARIIADIFQDDGAGDQTRFLKIRGCVCGSARAREFTVPAQRFESMYWVVEHVGADAVVEPGLANRDRARTAIQKLSGQIPSCTVYAHTGWRKIDGEWVYLHAAGAIGKDGPVDEVEVELPDDLNAFSLPTPPMGEDLIRAIHASLRIMDLGPARITVPVLAAIWRAVLGWCRESLHVVGPTGTFKTELAALAQQHFGASMDSGNLRGSWSSTENALEALAFHAKDAILVVDDFAPAGTSTDVQRLHQKAARLFRAQGNKAGRQRMRADTSMRSTRYPRGTILSSGEEVPSGHSILARTYLVEIRAGDISLTILTELQQHARNGLLAGAMAAYLKWLAPQYEQIRPRLRTEIADLRERASRTDQHRRTPEMVAAFYLAMWYFLEFATESGAIDADEKARLLDLTWRTLLSGAAIQQEHQKDADPVQVFLRILPSALGSGAAHIAAPDGNPPENPGAWGWRERASGSGQAAAITWQPEGVRIGWLEGENLYLDPEAAYRTVNESLRVSGGMLPVTPRTLSKRLDEQGKIRSREAHRFTVRRQLEGQRRTVLHLSVQTVFPTDDPASASAPDSQPEETPQDDDEAADEAGGYEPDDDDSHPRRTRRTGGSVRGAPNQLAKPASRGQERDPGAVGTLGTLLEVIPPDEMGACVGAGEMKGRGKHNPNQDWARA